LPGAALVREQGRTLAWRLDGEHLELAPVQAGQELGENVEVLSGLKEGDRVVLQPGPGLKPGGRVRVSSP
ncbi:MAG: efflux transporter periplasmic adaptor subunit, partial [Desulfarculus sp.]|nr:efflux transporter periplasmic adaptor subunit [Desulfarculus sp.]